jgi:hypothetical protein
MSICVGVNTLLATAATIMIGEVTPESVRTYVALNVDPWDNNAQINFEEPMGSFGIEYDIHTNIRLFAEHISSPMQCKDYPGINHTGVKFLAPINDLTVYSGISINNSDFDNNDNFDGPLVSLGVEYGKDFKIYAEHLAAIEKIEDGRTSFGLKVFFK